MQNKKVLTFISTHIINKAVISEYKKLSKVEGYDCILAIDNTNLKLQTASRICEMEFFNEKVKCFLFDENIHRELNLPYIVNRDIKSTFPKIMWFCADYRFYYVKKYFKDYDYYWQFDYDIFCNGNSYEPFLKRFEDNESDLLILNLRKEEKNSKWVWTHEIDWVYDDKTKIYGAFYPVSRISSSAVDFLYKKRIEQAESFINSNKFKKKRWLNCEIFTPTELLNGGFSCDEIIEPTIKLDEYDLNEERFFEKPDNLLYHSVKGNFLERLKNKNHKKTFKFLGFKISFEK